MRGEVVEAAEELRDRSRLFGELDDLLGGNPGLRFVMKSSCFHEVVDVDSGDRSGGCVEPMAAVTLLTHPAKTFAGLAEVLVAQCSTLRVAVQRKPEAAAGVLEAAMPCHEAGHQALGRRTHVAGLSGVSMPNCRYAWVVSRTFGVKPFKPATASAARTVCMAAGV